MGLPKLKQMEATQICMRMSCSSKMKLIEKVGMDAIFTIE